MTQHKTARGIFWAVADKWLDKIVGLVSIVVLARLLTPADFGLVAVAGAVAAAVEVLFAYGFDWALVRHPDPSSDHYSTAWTMRVVFGITCATLISAAAPAAAQFFHDPRIAGVLWVMGLATFVGSLENPGLAELRRQLNFRGELIARLSGRLAGFLVAISLAFCFRSYWALPLGSLATKGVTVLTSYAVHAFRPRWTMVHRKELLNFSVWLMINNLLEYLRRRAADLYVGKTVGTKELGVLSLSQELANIAVTEFAAPVNRVVFSNYSRMSADSVQLRAAYLLAAGLIWMISLPATVGLAVLAPIAVPLLFGNQWLDAIDVVQILCIGSALSVLAANTQYVFLARNEGRFVTQMTVAGTIVILALLPLLVPKMGLRGAALAYTLSSASILVPALMRVCRVLDIRLMDIVQAAWRPITSCVLMALVLQTFDMVNRPGVGVLAIKMTALVTLGACVYAAGLFLLWVASGRPGGSESYLLRLISNRLWRQSA